MKPGDWLILLVVLIFSLGSIYYLPKKVPGKICQVSVDGKPYARIDLTEDALLTDTIKTQNGTVVLERRDHRVCVAASSCPHKICRDRGLIGREGESIICVPNRFMAAIPPGQRKFDAVTE
jgi:hypothetical protein